MLYPWDLKDTKGKTLAQSPNIKAAIKTAEAAFGKVTVGKDENKKKSRAEREILLYNEHGICASISKRKERKVKPEED